MISFSAVVRFFKRGFSRAGESTLGSASWEAARTILVVVGWTLGLGLAGILLNVVFFVASLPEIIGLAKGGSDTIEGGGVLSILLRLIVAVSFIFTSPAALVITIVDLVVFPVLWTWIGLQHGWALSLHRWEKAVRAHLRDFADLVSKSAPTEAVDAVRATARVMEEVLGKMIAVRERSGVLIRWLSRGPAHAASQLKHLLHELPLPDAAESTERMLEDLGRRIRFALPAAILWVALVNVVWFLGIKFLL